MALNLPTKLFPDLSPNLDPAEIAPVFREDWSPAGRDFEASNADNWTPHASPFLFDDLHMNGGPIDIRGDDLGGAVLTIGDDAHRSSGIDTTVRLHDATADIKTYTPDQLSINSADMRPVIDVSGQNNTLNATFVEGEANINMEGASLEATYRLDRSTLHVSNGMAFINHSLDLSSSVVTIDAPVTGTGTVNIGFGVFDSRLEVTNAVSAGQTITVHSRDPFGFINLQIDDVAAFKGGIDLHEGQVLLANVLNIDHFVFTGDFLSLIDKSGTAVDTVKLTETGGVADTGNFHPMLVSQVPNGIMIDNSGQPPIGTVLSAFD